MLFMLAVVAVLAGWLDACMVDHAHAGLDCRYGLHLHDNTDYNACHSLA